MGSEFRGAATGPPLSCCMLLASSSGFCFLSDRPAAHASSRRSRRPQSAARYLLAFAADARSRPSCAPPVAVVPLLRAPAPVHTLVTLFSQMLMQNPHDLFSTYQCQPCPRSLPSCMYAPVITYVYYLFTYVFSKYFADRGTLLTVSAQKASKGSRFRRGEDKTCMRAGWS